MWRFLICITAAWASIGVAQAQSPAAIDWSGFHVGGLVGTTLALSDTRASPQRSGSTYFSGADFDQITGDGSGKLSEWKLSGSLKGGHSWQYGNYLVGVEASADTLLYDETRRTSVAYISQPASRYLLDQRVKADWMATLRLRLGWARDNWLVHVTAGPAVTRLTVDTTFNDNFTFGGASNAYGHSSNTTTKLGVAFGLGGDYALKRDWSLTAQYLYTDFGSVKTTTLVSHPGAGAGSSYLDSSADLRTHSAMVGLTYRFKNF